MLFVRCYLIMHGIQFLGRGVSLYDYESSTIHIVISFCAPASQEDGIIQQGVINSWYPGLATQARPYAEGQPMT
jgi:hypothetical protein